VQAFNSKKMTSDHSLGIKLDRCFAPIRRHKASYFIFEMMTLTEVSTCRKTQASLVPNLRGHDT
jgi:hypothetical protein